MLIAERENRKGHGVEIERCAADFWRFATHAITRDEDDEGAKRPFPISDEWSYLHELVDELESPDPVLVIPKSRRMIVTTTVAAWTLHKMLFTDAASGALWSECFISINEKKAKKYVERLVQIYDELPVWLQKPWETATQLDRVIEGGGSLEALNAGGDGPRSEGYAVGIMDEEAFQQNAERNYDALRQCAHKVILISSVNGRGNHFDRMYDDPTVKVLELHYTKHPKRDPATPGGKQWYLRARTGQTEAAWQREQEMNRDVYATAGYLSVDYKRASVAPVDWDGVGIIALGTDYSFNNPAGLWSFVDRYDRWCRLGEMLRHKVKIDEFYGDLFDQLQADYPGHRLRIAPDPFRGKQPKSGGNTDIEDIQRIALKSYGHAVQIGYNRIEQLKLRAPGHKIQRSLWLVREDIPEDVGPRFGTIIDPSCRIFIQGCEGAYGPKENATPHQVNDLEEPDPERDHVHIVDSDRYALVQYIRQTASAQFAGGHDTINLDLARRAAERAQLERIRRGI